MDENLPEAERVEAASTAAAAQEVAEGADPTSVAIVAPGAAGLYGLEVPQQNVSQSDANWLRLRRLSEFLLAVLGHDPIVFRRRVCHARTQVAICV